VTLLGRVHAARSVSLVAMAAVAIALGLVTRTQASHYVDALSLYRATIAANPDSWLAHNNLATILVTGAPAGVPEGIAHAREALRVKPDYAEARYNLAVGLEKTGDFAHAVEAYRRCRTLGDDPRCPQACAD
jgi:tetratricopeptide (TPR) repeat protein